MRSLYGEMSEWFKERAWKVRIRLKRIAGSNPALSAATRRSHWRRRVVFLHDLSAFAEASAGETGEVTEWSIVLDSKSSVPSGTGGSNPSLSALIIKDL